MKFGSKITALVIKYKAVLIIAGVILLIGIPFLWLFSERFESEAPFIETNLQYPAIGANQTLSVSVSDFKSGLREVWIGFIKEDNKKIPLIDKKYRPEGIEGLIRGGISKEDFFNIQIDPSKQGLKDGKVTLRLMVKDFSWRRWMFGNKMLIEQEVMIDTKPPKVEVLTKEHGIYQGGSCIAIYKLSEVCPETGVYVGSNKFPGYPGYFNDPNVYLSFFAVAYDQIPGTPVGIYASDFAGNAIRTIIPHQIRRRNFRKDTLNISDRFLEEKQSEFVKEIGKHSNMSLIDMYLEVNRRIRVENDQKISELTGNSEKTMYWENFFLRLPNSAARAGFGDHRDYKYNGQIIDRQVHLGIDLASLENAAVPAANTGKVIFAGDMGIYGKLLIIDHGFGVFSAYSHLSSIDALVGTKVTKGEKIGHTGSTGLAWGDHLHFAILVHRVFVNPAEWLDGGWIKTNILNKIEAVKNEIKN